MNQHIQIRDTIIDIKSYIKFCRPHTQHAIAAFFLQRNSNFKNITRIILLGVYIKQPIILQNPILQSNTITQLMTAHQQRKMLNSQLSRIVVRPYICLDKTHRWKKGLPNSMQIINLSSAFLETCHKSESLPYQ